MKAARCGTMSEQARHDAGWVTAVTVYSRCDNCLHADAYKRRRSSSWRCTKHDFSTKPNACCPDHKAGAGAS